MKENIITIRVTTPNYQQKIESILKTLQDGQEIVIRKSGEIRIAWYDGHKRKSRKAGNLFYNDEQVVKLQSKIPFAGSSKKSFYGMDKQPVTEKMPPINQLTLGLYIHQIKNHPELLENPNFEDYYYSKYRTVTVNGLTGFYNKNGKLVYIREEGSREMYSIPIQYESMVKEIMSCCDRCKNYFPVNKVKVYKSSLDHFQVFTLCEDCKEIAEKENPDIKYYEVK